MSAADLAGTTIYHHQFRNDQVNSADFVKNLTTLTPRGTPIYQIDGTGFIGYFSLNPLINGDGFVDCYAYARRLRDNDLAVYLEENGICWVIASHRGPNQGRIIDFHGLVVRESEAEMVFVVPDDGVNRHTDFRLFRLKRAGCR